MNRVNLMGRLTKDPEVRWTLGNPSIPIARYTLAVDRRGQKDAADFISCIAFNKSAEFAEKYLKKGMRMCVSGRIQTGSYQNQQGQKVYTTDVIVDDQEFAESKAQSAPAPAPQEQAPQADAEGWMSVPEGPDGEALPWN